MNVKFFATAALVVTSALLVTACQTMPYQGSARDVKRKPGVGGTIAVPMNPQQADRDRATEHMISNCGNGNYKITEEGEVVVGESTQSDQRNSYRDNNQHQAGSFLGMPVYSGDAGGVDTHATQTRTQMKEWQLGYECNGAAVANAMPVAEPMAAPTAARAKARRK